MNCLNSFFSSSDTIFGIEAILSRISREKNELSGRAAYQQIVLSIFLGKPASKEEPTEDMIQFALSFLYFYSLALRLE